MTSGAPNTLPPQSGAVPHADATTLTTPFWQGCAVGELRFQRCTDCNHPNFPPTEHCRMCASFNQVWERSTGRGRLYSWTVVNRPVTPAFVPPYAPAIVTLDEGYQMISNVIGVGVDALRIDLELRVEFHRVGDDALWLPYFTGARP
ncbi:Zn-ribbon domain-containing OB-fold protein [Mycobacterium rhizamassiliense]|jgi:uncharacterized protein|nr:OB-fold domain-containing protein [Mycobacterium rhizamassiliense]